MESSEEQSNSVKIQFRSKKKNKCLRIKRNSSDSEDEKEENMSTLLEDAKELRKLRKRQNGVSAVGLALGKKLSNEEELIVDDPFKLKTGGFIDMKAMNRRGRTGTEELDAVNLGSVFSAETNRRDEDADMMKYIEEELHKIKGKSLPPSKIEALTKSYNYQKKKANGNAHESDGSVGGDGPLKTDNVLFEVPEHLRQPVTKKSEEMLSNQMLSGIPEVDLGIEERIRNIEATEEAKLQVLRERMKKKEQSMSFVPTNMAVNFVQHNRFNIDDDQPKLKKRKDAVPVDKNSPPKIMAPKEFLKLKQMMKKKQQMISILKNSRNNSNASKLFFTKKSYEE
ncbi:telomere length and silencing protein 1 homolog [Caerostris extrusa]|uniref:Telomere length and silencing protein 1 homolog n=1 Tax=Caerostris extrusa TaxID=172846 RepID=A0AAV4XCI5_CAEEX|nr:telomere length and silencing protein 1 homolog [Caerostris extrusa]